MMNIAILFPRVLCNSCYMKKYTDIPIPRVGELVYDSGFRFVVKSVEYDFEELSIDIVVELP